MRRGELGLCLGDVSLSTGVGAAGGEHLIRRAREPIKDVHGDQR
jgi:hypothetical protein